MEKNNKFLKYLYYIFQSINMLISLAVPIFIKKIVDAVSDKDYALFKFNAIIFCVLILAFIFTLALSYYFMIYYEEKELRRLRSKFYKYLGFESLNNLKSKSLGSIIQLFNSDLEGLRAFIIEMPYKRIVKGIYLVLIIFLMLRENILLSASILILLPIFYFIQNKMSEKEAVVNKSIEEANEKLNGNIEEFYNYNYTIKAFNSSEDTIIKNEAGLDKYLEKVFERLKIDIVYDYFMSNGLLNILDLIIYIFGGFLVFKGSVSIGTLILFSQYVSKLWNPIEFYMSYPREKSLYEMHKERLDSVINFESKLIDEDAKDFESLELKDLSIEYNELILDKINLEIKKGDKILIKGGNGTGKTSLLRAIAGIESDYSGELFLNGSRVDKESNLLNKMIRLVPDKADIFYGSIEENINMFSNKSVNKDTKIIKALEKNNLCLDTVLASSMNNLSGGEKKLIELERTFQSTGDIFIFDEPLNYIDKNNTELVIDCIKDFTKDKTVVLVSHNESIEKIADKVYEIKNKKLIRVK